MTVFERLIHALHKWEIINENFQSINLGSQNYPCPWFNFNYIKHLFSEGRQLSPIRNYWIAWLIPIVTQMHWIYMHRYNKWLPIYYMLCTIQIGSYEYSIQFEGQLKRGEKRLSQSPRWLDFGVFSPKETNS